MQVIAYTYDADTHCYECTVKYLAEAYGIDEEDVAADFDDYEDFEGNPIHPLFDTDEWYANDIYEGREEATLHCSDCHKELAVMDLTDWLVG